MKCETCDSRIDEGCERTHFGRTLCEDCYIDALSPAKPCDPWAVYTAKSLTKEGPVLTKLQETILQILNETNGVEPEVLAGKLNLPLDALQREVATLRHMEKIRASMIDGKKMLCPW